MLTSTEGGLAGSIEAAKKLQAEGKGVLLDQFSSAENAEAHYVGTGPEIWRDTDGKVTHFVAIMGTSGTLRCS